MSMENHKKMFDRTQGGNTVEFEEIGIPVQALFTLREAATIFKVHVRTVERWIEERRLVAIILPGGKSLRITYHEMMKIFSQTTTSDDTIRH